MHDGDPGPYLEHKRDAVTVHEKEIDGLLRLAQSWHQAQARYGRREAVMITRDNLTRERLNRLVRARLRADGVVGGDGIVVSGREFATGDRVIARRNNRTADVDNGSIGTIIAVGDDDSVIIETDAGEPRALDAAYVAEHLEHAYVLTSHSAQGATVTWAGVIGRPGDFTREWAYTALSRARTHTAIHVISQRPERARERDDYAPAEPDPTEEETLRALDRAMRRTESEPLAVARVAPRLTPSFRSPSSGMNSEPSGSDVLRNRRPELRASITM